jgi:hypothetical protein
MQFNRARALSTASTIHQGASGMGVRSSMAFLAFVCCSQRVRAHRRRERAAEFLALIERQVHVAASLR